MIKKMQVIAEEYHKRNIPVFPVQITLKDGGAMKMPLVKEWEKVTVDSFKYLDFSQCNGIGMPTGKVSGVFVLDLDIGSELNNRPLPPTVCQKTGSGGMHYFFKYKEGIRNRNAMEYKIDIRGEGGYVVLAPSDHPMGEYEWIVSFDDAEVADAPLWLMEKMEVKKVHDTKLAYGVGMGRRNESAASVIGHVLARIHESYWHDFGLEGLRAWNKRNTPPMSDEELVKVFKSIAAKEYATRTK